MQTRRVGFFQFKKPPIFAFVVSFAGIALLQLAALHIGCPVSFDNPSYTISVHALELVIIMTVGLPFDIDISL